MKKHSVVDSITNSSSTTFIIGLKENPKDIDDVKKVFSLEYGNVSFYEYEIASSQAADIIWTDLKVADRITSLEELIEEFQNGWFPGYPDDNFYRSEDYYKIEKLNKDFYKKHVKGSNSKAEKAHLAKIDELRLEFWRKHNIKVNQTAKKSAEEHWERLKDLDVYVLSYSDNDGECGIVMEHGGIFDHLPHVAISHH